MTPRVFGVGTRRLLFLLHILLFGTLFALEPKPPKDRLLKAVLVVPVVLRLHLLSLLGNVSKGKLTLPVLVFVVDLEEVLAGLKDFDTSLV
jgi:hypothetical protein